MVFFSKPSNWINILNSAFFLFESNWECVQRRERTTTRQKKINWTRTQSIKIWFWTTSRIRRSKINERTNEKKKFKCSSRGDHLRINSSFFSSTSSLGSYLTSMRSRSIHCVHTDWNQMDIIIFWFVGILRRDVCVRAITIELNAHWSVISPINKEFKREFNRWSESKHFYGWKEEQVEFEKKKRIKKYFRSVVLYTAIVRPTNIHGI